MRWSWWVVLSVACDVGEAAPEPGSCAEVTGSWQATEKRECGLGMNGVTSCFWTISFDDDGTFAWSYSDIYQEGDWTCADGAITGTWPSGAGADGTIADGALTWDGVPYEPNP
ncbi:MAG: hypothetical protein AAF602_05900 [Myxococcota bacterium]